MPPKLYLSPGIVVDPTADIGPAPGWYAVSVSFLRGAELPAFDGQGGREHIDSPYFTYFLNFRPVAMTGYSIYLYHITAADADELQRQVQFSRLREPPEGSHTIEREPW